MTLTSVRDSGSTPSLTLRPQRGAERQKTIILAPGRGGAGQSCGEGPGGIPKQVPWRAPLRVPHGRKITGSNFGCLGSSPPTSPTAYSGAPCPAPPQACRLLRAHTESLYKENDSRLPCAAYQGCWGGRPGPFPRAGVRTIRPSPIPPPSPANGPSGADSRVPAVGPGAGCDPLLASAFPSVKWVSDGSHLRGRCITSHKWGNRVLRGKVAQTKLAKTGGRRKPGLPSSLLPETGAHALSL